MIKYIKSTKNNIEQLMSIRFEMLKIVNTLPEEYAFSEELITESKRYFENGNQSTVLAFDEDVIGCATICYIDVMPTFSHPSGKRAHLMNVYTNQKYRRQGIACEMLKMLINEAKEKGVTEISLDATESGRPLYKKMGFIDSHECMVLSL